jgi:predicted MPP superfamily phosphohydrolase
MKRSVLPPPRQVDRFLDDEAAGSKVAVLPPGLPDAAHARPHGDSAAGPGGRKPLHHGRLAGPRPARQILRHFFDPRSGWFRLLERNTNILLSRHLYPLIPGMQLPYGTILGRSLTVSDAEIALPLLPHGFEGATILLITDIHSGPFLSRRALQRAFDRLLALEPDLVLLGGDLATTLVADVVAHLEVYRNLEAPLGVFAVLGNHDHYTREPARLRGLLEDNGIRVLHNESVVLERAGGRIVLAGIDDLYKGEPDLDAALASANGLPVVLLSHNPDVVFDASRRGVPLVLAGHTHGGQLRFPGLPVIVRQSRYRLDEGRYTIGGTELIVSRGLGVNGIPLRVACPPEAVLITLRVPPSRT